MSTSDTVNAGYLESLLAGRPHVPASPLAWLNTLRSEAVDRVGVLTVPTQRDEEWRFTDISQLNRMSFHPVRTTVDLQAEEAGRFRIEEAASRLVFVDGVYAPHLSMIDADNGVSVVNLEAGLAANAVALESCLGRYAEFRNEVFSALNTAFLQDAALVVVPIPHFCKTLRWSLCRRMFQFPHRYIFCSLRHKRMWQAIRAACCWQDPAVW